MDFAQVGLLAERVLVLVQIRTDRSDRPSIEESTIDRELCCQLLTHPLYIWRVKALLKASPHVGNNPPIIIGWYSATASKDTHHHSSPHQFIKALLFAFASLFSC